MSEDSDDKDLSGDEVRFNDKSRRNERVGF